MFDIKNISLKDYIIISLVLVLLFVGYKYYININQIINLTEQNNILVEQIKHLKDTIIINNQLMDESNNSSDEYNKNTQIETFNNSNILKCTDSMCFFEKPNNIQKSNNLESNNIQKSNNLESNNIQKSNSIQKSNNLTSNNLTSNNLESSNLESSNLESNNIIKTIDNINSIC
jgi:hypothetical protein